MAQFMAESANGKKGAQQSYAKWLFHGTHTQIMSNTLACYQRYGCRIFIDKVTEADGSFYGPVSQRQNASAMTVRFDAYSHRMDVLIFTTP
jgi:hypothetical protein